MTKEKDTKPLKKTAEEEKLEKSAGGRQTRDGKERIELEQTDEPEEHEYDD